MRIVIDDNCLNSQGGNGGASYDDSAILARLQKLENRTDNFVKDVTVSREGNKVKFTYTRVDGTSSEAEFDDKDTITAIYDDTELRQRVTQLEAKEDSDKQTLSLQDRTLSISNGNSVTLPASGGSIASAISAYSGSYEDSEYDFFIKGGVMGNMSGSTPVPALSDGELQLITSDSYDGIRIKDPVSGVVTTKIDHYNLTPSFGKLGYFAHNSTLVIEIISNTESTEPASLFQGYLNIPRQDASYQGINTYMLNGHYNLVGVISLHDPKKATLTLFKESHTYTTIGSYTYVDEHTMEGEFDFPVYANFGLEEKFKKLKLNLNC